MKKNITMLIKPASSLCNLRCKYCFYADIAENREIESFGVMNIETAENIIKKALTYACGGVVSFAFQGGEPTVAPLEFFKEFVKIANENNSQNANISYAIQTNGTLLTEEHCEFFKQNNFLVGVSLDGKSDIHNANRVDAKKNGTFSTVMQGINMLKKHKVDFNILTVVTNLTPKNAQGIFKFFKAQKLNYLQFITCLEPIGAQPFTSGFAPDNDGYFKFYKAMLDLYLKEKRGNGEISIRYFDNLIGMLNGNPPELCGMSGVCSGQLIIEGNGNCYPCDFYCEDKYLLGNINDNSLEEMAVCENMRKFQLSSQKVDEKCKTCSVRGLCRGGCRRERDYFSTGELNLNMYCDGRKKFFEYFISQMRG